MTTTRYDEFKIAIKPWGPCSPMPNLFKEGYLNTYPYNMRDEFSTEEVVRSFPALVIENEFLRATVAPDLGARLASLYDKVAGEEVFLKPAALQPAPIVLRGAYIPLGIEFNVPCGHGIHSAEPVPCRFVEGEDGAASIRIDVYNAATGLHTVLWFELRPGERKLRTRTEFRNLLPVRNGFMYWANAAVAQTEGMFFQCRAPMCFFFVAYAPFPIVNGRNTMLARERDFPSDMFAIDAIEPWFGFYQPEREFGAVHLSPPGEVVGKKLFSWSYDEYGMRWGKFYRCDIGRGVNGYVECQAGIPETQMEFSHLEPMENRLVHEEWMPYHGLGAISHATGDLIFSKEADSLRVTSTRNLTDLVFHVGARGEFVRTSVGTLVPGEMVELQLPAAFDPNAYDLRVESEAAGLLLNHAVRDAVPAGPERIAEKQAWLDMKPEDEPSRREVAFRRFKQRLFTDAERLSKPDEPLLVEIEHALHRREFMPGLPEIETPDRYARVAQADALAARRKWREAAEVVRSEAGQFPSVAILHAWLKVEGNGAAMRVPEDFPAFQPDDNPFTVSERKALEALLSHSPDHPTALHLLGNYFAGRMREDEKALACWQKVAAAYPGRWQVARNIGYVQTRLRNFVEAEAGYSEAACLQPAVVNIRAERFKVLSLLGRVDEALAEVQSLPGEMAGDYRLRKWHAYLLRDAGRFHESLKVLLEGEVVINWEGECGHHRCYLECHRALGLEALADGSLDVAKRHFDALLEYPEVLLHGKPKLENRAIGHYHLALWAEAAGNKEMARAQLREAADQPLPHAHHWISYRENEYFGALAARKLADEELERKITERLTEFYFGDDYKGAAIELQSFASAYVKPLAAARGFLLAGDFAKARTALRHGEMDLGPCHPLEECRATIEETVLKSAE